LRNAAKKKALEPPAATPAYDKCIWLQALCQFHNLLRRITHFSNGFDAQRTALFRQSAGTSEPEFTIGIEYLTHRGMFEFREFPQRLARNRVVDSYDGEPFAKSRSEFRSMRYGSFGRL
jgi:hypothetical protein